MSEELNYKYVVNVVYQHPYLLEDGKTLNFVLKSDSLVYIKEEDAQKAYNLFNEKHLIEYDTEVGSISFFVVLAELVHIDKLNEIREQVIKEAEQLEEN